MNRNFRGGSAFCRPENALKRAEELQKVGQKNAAVLALHDVLTSRRHRTWAKGLEDIVFRFIDLCVEERKGRYAKEALMQYRNTCQNVNINSLEEVIKYLLKKATERAEDAQAKANAATLDVDDLDDDQSPEDIMLSYVSDKSGKDRNDRELVTPWFKFLWETYRNVLDILRNNVKFTQMYGMVTKQAFQFCLQYKRTTEFRRLCEILRNQLQMLKKNERNREQRDRPDLSNPETLNQCLETRFEQLNVACQLEMWQEAFRSIEDIHGLWALNKRMPKPGLRAQYFSCLTDIFSKSGSHVYHAYSWFQLFSLSAKLNKNLTVEDKSSMASAVLLSTLSIEPYDRRGPESLGERTKADRASRIVDILGFNHDPTRSPEDMLSRTNLLAELTNRNIMSQVPENVAAIFRILEQDRDPLTLCLNIQPYLAALEAQVEVPLSPAAPVRSVNHGQHVQHLRSVAVLKMMRHLSSVYSVMKMDKLAALVPFMTFSEVEAVLADAIKYGYVQVQIDHRSSTLHFGGAQLKNDAMANHLATVASRLSSALAMIDPTASEKAAEARQRVAAARARETAEQENKTALARKVLIERRREENERSAQEAEREEEEKRRREQEALEEAEKRRRREEAMRREEERINREYAEQEAEEVKKMMAEKGIVIKDGETLDKKALMQKQYDQKLREQTEFEQKMNKLAKSLDHLERARREEEIPYLRAVMQKRIEQDRIYYERQQEELLTQHRKQWEMDLEAKHRTARMAADRDVVKKAIVERRAEEIARLKAEAEARKKAMAKQRKLVVEEARKKEYVKRCRDEITAKLADLEEKARIAAEDEARREKEESKARLAKRIAEEREKEEAAAKAAREKVEAQRAAGAFVPRHKLEAVGAVPKLSDAAPAAAAAAPSAGAADGGEADRWAPRGAPAQGGGRPAAEPYRPRTGAYQAGPSAGAFGAPRRDAGSSAFGGAPRERESGFASSAFGSRRDAPPRDGPPRDGPAPYRAPARPAEGDDGAPAPAPRPAASGGGYVPPHLRGKR